jgi:hypothetical protein
MCKIHNLERYTDRGQITVLLIFIWDYKYLSIILDKYLHIRYLYL